jgi:hypothetical protein
MFIASVGPGAQDLLGPVQVAALGQQVGQPPGIILRGRLVPRPPVGVPDGLPCAISRPS